MIPVSEAREQLADLVNRVAYRRERITLGRRGKKIAAIVSAEDLDLGLTRSGSWSRRGDSCYAFQRESGHGLGTPSER